MLRIALFLLLSGGIIAYFFYQRIVGDGAVTVDRENPYVHVPTNASFEQVLDTLTSRGIISNVRTFRRLAAYMEYPRDPMRAGRFELKPGMNMVDLIRQLRGGKQAPVDLVLTTEREPQYVAAKAARFIEPDSLALWEYMQQLPVIEELGYTRENFMSLFIPNTYEFFWNTSPEGFVKRMQREHEAFWEKKDRRAKAEKLGLTPAEAYTLASIVEKETLVNAEKKRMAGVYLNRLEKGMLLQADPTAVFASRDFGTKRVTNYHTAFDSPYNTYRYPGLPPGPITMASISSIDAVLNAEQHDYLYFCAIGDGSGKHAFAKTLSQHNANARRYYANLRKRGLR